MSSLRDLIFYYIIFYYHFIPSGFMRRCVSKIPLIEGWREATGWMYFHRTHYSINVSSLRNVNLFKLRRSGIIIEITEIKKRKSSEGAIYS
jgi:hypothetical protein